MDTHPQDIGQVRGAVRERQDLERPAGMEQDPGQVCTGEPGRPEPGMASIRIENDRVR